jgi:tetratricopeptide (TPR) repeat protein
LKAGAYGLHMIPKEGENWIVIFSNCSTAWGSYTYDPAEDELRMAVSPEPDDFSEWLTYEVSDKGADYMVLSLVWEKIRIPIRIDIDVQSTVVDNLKQELRSGSRFDAAVWDQAARYCLGNNIALEQALEWVNFAISGPIFSARANFPYLRTKSLILEKLGRTEEATAVFQEAMSLPNTEAGDLYQHGRQLIREKQLDKARDFFEKTIDRFPAHWLGEHGLARVFSEIGDFKQAVHHEEKALELAPESSKDVVKTYLQKLKDGKNIN